MPDDDMKRAMGGRGGTRYRGVFVQHRAPGSTAEGGGDQAGDTAPATGSDSLTRTCAPGRMAWTAGTRTGARPMGTATLHC